MSFQQFISSITECFNTVFSHIIIYIDMIIQNNFIKFIIFLSLVFFIIWIAENILKIVYTIFNIKHDKEKHDKETGKKEIKKKEVE